MALSKRAARIKEFGQGIKGAARRKGRGKLIPVGRGSQAGKFQGAETDPTSTIDRDQALTELYADSSVSILAEREAALRETWDALMHEVETGSERCAAANLGLSRHALRKMRAASRALDHDAAVQRARQALGEFTRPAAAPEPEVAKTIHNPTVKNIPGKALPEFEQIERELKLWPYPGALDDDFNLRWLPFLRQWGLLLRRQGEISYVMLRSGEIVTTRHAMKPGSFGAWRILGGPDNTEHGFIERLVALLEFESRMRRALLSRNQHKAA